MFNGGFLELEGVQGFDGGDDFRFGGFGDLEGTDDIALGFHCGALLDEGFAEEFIGGNYGEEDREHESVNVKVS